MNEEEFHQLILRKLNEYSAVPLHHLGPDDRFLSTGLVDSVTIVELIQLVEDYWKIRVNPMDLSTDNFDSIAAICAFARVKRGAVD